MKNLLYIGNQLLLSGKTATTIETLSANLSHEGYNVITASKKKNKIFRLCDMLYHIFKFKNDVSFVLIDTYSTQNFYYAYLCSQLSRLLKLSYIPILHGGNLPNRLKNSPKLSNSIFKNSYKNIAPSEYIKTSFENLGYFNLEVIPNTIEISNYQFQQRKIKNIKLLWVRSFSSIYNPNLAIDILKKLKERGLEASLCMVGPENDGSLRKSKAHAINTGVDVKFTGRLSKKEWTKLSKEYNIFINTTNFDNTPVSIIEAMALGLPVISTNVGGMPFLIQNGEDGLLVEPNDVELFIEAIQKIQKNSEKTTLMIEKARKKVEQFDWEQVKEKWSKLLN